MVSYRKRRQEALKSSPVIFIFVMVTVVALCFLYDSDQVIHNSISYLMRPRRSMVETTTPPPLPSPMLISLSDRQNAHKTAKHKPHKTVVAICALSKSKPEWQEVHDTSVYKLFLAGIYRTTSGLAEYSIQVHVGVDSNDPFWSKHEHHHALVLASARDFKLTLTVHHYPKKHRDHLPMNELMRDAARTGAEYLVRLNDDSELTSMGWLPLAVHRLLAYDPPNVGVVGPVCREGKTSILTHDMVHRTHLDIFETYYPPQFHNWYVDDWISEVYGRDRTTKIPGWTVHHHVGPPRYNPIMVDKETLRKTIRDGNERVQIYLSKRNVSRKLSQVNIWEKKVVSKNLTQTSNMVNSTTPARTPPATASRSTPVLVAR